MSLAELEHPTEVSMTKWRALGPGLALMIAVGYADVASAAPITLQFQGTVVGVFAPLAGTFAVGDSFTTQITFESTTPDLQPNATSGIYLNAITAWSLIIGSTNFAMGPTAVFPQIAVSDANSGPSDSVQFTVFDFSGGLGPMIGGLNPVAMNLDFVDLTGTALASDALPTTVNVSAFAASRTLSINYQNPNTFDSGFLVGTVSTGGVVNPVAPVPEPATSLLITSGLAASALVRRRRRRS
jgi:hypothetical protein